MSHLECFEPDQIRYELEDLLGEGLNSKVYRALRIDVHGQMRQRVALKFLKDQSSVSFLRREFETLLSVRSDYCARVIAWETRGQDSILALEWVDGLTLFDLSREQTLSPSVCDELVRQIFIGLTDLKSAGLHHGDLQPKNVMVDRKGCVRLIDFASGCTPDGRLQATPDFVAPEIFRGAPLAFEADLFALGTIANRLPHGFAPVKSTRPNRHVLTHENPNRRLEFRPANANRAAQTALAEAINRVLCAKEGPQTQIFSAPLVTQGRGPRRLARTFTKTAVAMGALLLCAVTVPGRAEAPSPSHGGFAKIQIRSEHWMQISLNGREIGYAPQDLTHLQSGTHRLSWKSALGAGEMRFDLSAGDVVRLVETQTHAGEFKVR